MAELLIKAVDATHADPAKDARGCYKRGDVVVVMPDGHEWGRLEALPPDQGGKFVILKLPGVSLAQLHAEAAKHTKSGLLEIAKDQRRAVKIDLDALAKQHRDDAARNGTITLDKSAVASIARDKPTKEKRDATDDLGRR